MIFFHRHKWKFVSANESVHRDFSFAIGRMIETGQTTMVVYMCEDCKKFKTKYLDGKHAQSILKAYKELEDEKAKH